MKINKIISQHRRDFVAELECESCGTCETLTNGYDDDNYHRNVIPKMKCKSCGEVSPDEYRPLTTQWPAWKVI